MSVQSKRLGVPARKTDKLLRLLEEQQRVLAAAGGDKRLIAEHNALIQYLKLAPSSDLQRIFMDTPPKGDSSLRLKSKVEVEISEAALAEIPIVEVKRIIENQLTSRKYLESIAIHRFKVPRGSMRSFANRAMLVEKLQTMLRNEEVHFTIKTVARRQI